MRKSILLGTALVALALSMGSCNKCYVCTGSYHTLNGNGNDSVVNLKTELCNHGNNSAGTNLNVAVADLQANGYVCTAE